MPSSRQLIASQVLSSPASSVTFSSIPGTFKDLILVVSARSARGVTFDQFQVGINGISDSVHSNTQLRFSGSAVSSNRYTAQGFWSFEEGITSVNATTNTFNSAELYIPNYASNTNKVSSGFSVAENNATAGWVSVIAGLWRNTSTVTSLVCYTNSLNFVGGSSFYLYGLAN